MKNIITILLLFISTTLFGQVIKLYQVEPIDTNSIVKAEWEAYIDGLAPTGTPQTLSTTGVAGYVAISDGNNITINVDDHDNRTALDLVSGTNTGDQSLSNYVTLNTAQTISATKTFTADQKISLSSAELIIQNTSGTSAFGGLSLRDESNIEGMRVYYDNQLNRGTINSQIGNLNLGVAGFSKMWITNPTGQLGLVGYTATSSFPVTAAGMLVFDSSGNIGTATISGGSGTDLSYSGTSSPITLNSSTGNDVTITAGTNITISGSTSNLTINSSGGSGLVDPMTTRGDIIYRNSSNVSDRLALGTTGGFIGSNGTDLVYDYTHKLSKTIQPLTANSSTVPLDANSGYNAVITVTTNPTFTLLLSNLVQGTTGNITIVNATAGGAITLSGYTNKLSQTIYTAANIVTTSGSSKIDVLSWYYDGTRLIWNGAKDYK